MMSEQPKEALILSPPFHYLVWIPSRNISRIVLPFIDGREIMSLMALAMVFTPPDGAVFKDAGGDRRRGTKAVRDNWPE